MITTAVVAEGYEPSNSEWCMTSGTETTSVKE